MKFGGKLIYWSPRVLSLGFVLFISVFALDVFSEYSGFAVVFPLIIHLLPSLLLLIVSILAWKHTWVGALIFLGFAGFYVWDVGLSRPLRWSLAIALPSFVVGLLYLISWLHTKKQLGVS